MKIKPQNAPVVPGVLLKLQATVFAMLLLSYGGLRKPVAKYSGPNTLYFIFSFYSVLWVSVPGRCISDYCRRTLDDLRLRTAQTRWTYPHTLLFVILQPQAAQNIKHV